jgi:metal-responsive CopG/Arc/MetJ family transcriptional regulator
MKIKTSITLSETLLIAIDERAEQEGKNRSEYIESAVWAAIRRVEREEQEARDREILARRAAGINREVAEALGRQGAG